MVEIFKTTISDVLQAASLVGLFKKHYPQYTVNFDLEDCDRILRVESTFVENETIIAFMTWHGHVCETLN